MQMTAAVTSGRHHPDPTVLDQRGKRRAGMSAAELGGDVCGTDQVPMALESAVRTAEPAPAWLGDALAAGRAGRGRFPLLHQVHPDPGLLGLVA
jgi:hypothetical protein